MEELSKTKQRIEYLKEGPKGFQAKVTDTTIKVFNANNDEEER